MSVLKFKSLKILSNKTGKAAQFKFKSRFNLILADGKNSVGKTSVVKNIFWSLGCDPNFDGKWDELDSKSLLEFEVDRKPYWVARHANRIFLSEDGISYRCFLGIGGEYSKTIAKIVNFNALLPKRGEDLVIVPPPAFYFTAFYIDQKLSWANAWASFGGLGQFSDWKKEIVPYVIGITKKEYFDLTEDIFSIKQESKEVYQEIERITSAISVVDEFVPNVDTTLDIQELAKIRDELKVDVLSLHETQEVIFEKLATLKSEKAHSESQLVIAKKAVVKLQSDYEFAQDADGELICPTCGVEHDNSLTNKFSLLEDKDQAEQIVQRFESCLLKLDKEITVEESELSSVRDRIQRLNEKYYKEEKETVFTLQNILDSVASHSVKHKVEEHKKNKSDVYHNLKDDEDRLTKQRKGTAIEPRKNINKYFQNTFPSYTAKLKAFGVNSSSVRSPMNYGKVAKSGGAAESTRAMLAYYLVTYNLIHQYSEVSLSPLIIDTPNQHEQAAKHYESIVDLIKNNAPEEAQVFLCGMDSEKLNPLKESGGVIKLDKEHSLLEEEHYEEVASSIGWIFELSED